MDSLTQAVLGAAVGVAVMGRRTRPARAAAWGAVAGTLPDLDVLVGHGDPILDMVLHRAESHALFWLTALSLPLALAVSRLHGEADRWRRWWAALWLALVTHPLLDVLTVYGTQLLLPFTDRPYGLGSVFIIDPLVTVPWAVGLAAALRAGWRSAPAAPAASVAPHPPAGVDRGLRANRIGLAVGTAYLLWGAAAQQLVLARAHASLQAEGIRAERVMATPAPFNTVLWRVVAVAAPGPATPAAAAPTAPQQPSAEPAHRYHEGFHSLLDGPGPIRFTAHDQGRGLADQLSGQTAPNGLDGLARIQAFTRGFWALQAAPDGRLLLTDLRMGQEPHYVFRFAIAQRDAATGAWLPLAPAQAAGSRGPIGPSLAWLWRRMRGEPVAPPG